MVQLRYSGGATNQFATASIGGAMSDTQIPNNVIHNLFDIVTRVEVINGRTDHRMFYIYNDVNTKYFKCYLGSIQIPENAEISFAIDGSEIPQQLQREDQLPVNLSFYEIGKWNKLKIPIGHFEHQKKIPIWIKRKVLTADSEQKMIDFNIEATVDSITISANVDFHTKENIMDNFYINVRNSYYYTNVDKVGEVILR